MEQQCLSTRRDMKCKFPQKCSSGGNGGRVVATGDSCKRTLNKIKSMCAERQPAEKLKSKCRHGSVGMLALLTMVILLVLQFAQSSTGNHLLSATRMEMRRISNFLMKTWRQFTGVSQPKYDYPGLVPPYVSQPFCSEPVPLVSDTGIPYSTIESGPDFDICICVSIGDDGGQPRNEALPYQLVYSRLFSAMREEIGAARDLRHKRGENKTQALEVLVGVDYQSIVCKMFRDFVEEIPGVVVAAQCKNFEQLLKGTKCGVLISGSSQRFVPQISPLFEQFVKWKRHRLLDLDCSRPEENVPQFSNINWRPTVVTGFSSNHLAVGLLMLRSLGKAAKEAGAKELGPLGISLVVYAMEIFKPEQQRILDCVIHELNSEYNVRAELRLFDFGAHPKWMHVNQSLGYFGGTGQYAWKAIMVHTVLRERGLVLWADAGNRFRDSPALIETLNTLRLTGFVSRKSHGTIWTRTHPLQLKFFRADVSPIWDLQNCEAAIVGFTLNKYEELARPWYECSLIKQCIAPDGSDRSNHRQDQAALSVLSILSGSACEGAHPQFSDHMDDDSLDSERVFTPGVHTSHCYVDPLRLDLPQGTYLDHGREGPYIWH